MSVRARPLTTHGLGAVVTGVDLGRPLSGSERGALLEILYTAGVVRVPARHLTAASLEAFALALGVPEVVRPVAHRLSGSSYIRHQTSVPGLGVAGGGMYWHADGCWRPVPTAATVLGCVVAPAGGGATRFVDARAVHRTLPSSLRTRSAAATGLYPVRSILAADHRAAGIDDPELLEALRDVRHPLVRRHPVTGEESLILNQMMLAEVCAAEDAEGAELLAELYAAVEDTPFAYVHAWTPGDVLLWDNRIVMHRADPVPPKASKVTWRITLDSIEPGALVSDVREGLRDDE